MKLKTKLIIAFMAMMTLPTVFLIIARRVFEPREIGELQQMFMIIVFFTAALLVYWVYRTVSVPLAKLQEAAQNIKDGNLDFEITAEADDEFGELCRPAAEGQCRGKGGI